MDWLKNNIIAIFMALVVCLAAAAGYGAIRQQCRQFAGQIDAKADKEAIYRELDQIRTQLTRMESKIDGLLRFESGTD